MIERIQLGDDLIDLNSSQRLLFNALFNENLSIYPKYREYAFYGAIRCGKSYAMQLAGFLIALQTPNVRILWVRDTYKELQDSVIQQFRSDFEKYGQFIYKISEREAVFHNDGSIKFRSFDVDGTSMLSAEYDAIFFCQAEAIAEQWFMLALGRLSGTLLPRPLMFTEGNPGSTWVKRRYKDKTKEDLEKAGILFIEAQTIENEHNLSDNYINILKDSYDEVWFNRYVLGGWDAVDEMVFHNFRESLHVVDMQTLETINAFKKRIGMDYGWVNPTALVWGYVDYDGCLVIFDEWGGTQKMPQEIASASNKYGKLVIVCDYSIKRPDRDGRSLWDDLKRQGMNLIESNKQEIQNISLANQLLKTGRLKITRNCTHLINEIKNYKFKRLRLGDNKNNPEQTVDKDNHYIDALLYLIASLEELKTTNPLDIAYKKSLKYLNMQSNDGSISKYS